MLAFAPGRLAVLRTPADDGEIALVVSGEVQLARGCHALEDGTLVLAFYAGSRLVKRDEWELELGTPSGRVFLATERADARAGIDRVDVCAYGRVRWVAEPVRIAVASLPAPSPTVAVTPAGPLSLVSRAAGDDEELRVALRLLRDPAALVEGSHPDIRFASAQVDLSLLVGDAVLVTDRLQAELDGPAPQSVDLGGSLASPAQLDAADAIELRLTLDTIASTPWTPLPLPARR